MVSPKTISEYINRQVTAFNKITLRDFIIDIQAQFYPDQDISFMDYFLELSEEENQGQFVVHHEKLFEYGATVSKQSSVIKERLDAHCMAENEDYSLQKFLEPLKGKRGGATSGKNVYMLTPECFKTILIGATKHKKHTTDVLKYRKYYLFLEAVVGYYMKYELSYAQRIISRQRFQIELKNASIFKNEYKVLSLDEKIDRQSAQISQQSDEIRELLGYAKDTNATLKEVQDDLTETQEDVKIAKSFLTEKSIVSTMNPSDESKHHYFAATTYTYDNKDIVKFLTGQKSYVDRTLDKRVVEDDHEVIIQPFYNANGIDLRQNVYEEFSARRTVRIKVINETNKLNDEVFNSQLKITISKHNKANKANPERKRVFSHEKRKTPLVRIKDIPVKFKMLSFEYTPNTHMSFKEVLQIIIDVNGITQESPLPSDEE